MFESAGFDERTRRLVGWENTARLFGLPALVWPSGVRPARSGTTEGPESEAAVRGAPSPAFPRGNERRTVA